MKTSKGLWNALLVSPAVLGATLLVSTDVTAEQGSELQTSETAIVKTKQTPMVAMASGTKEEITVAEIEILEPVSVGKEEPTEEPALVAEMPADTSDASILEEIRSYSNDYRNDGISDENVMEQVNSVSQLRDVSPGDWAYEALRNLVERYGCIVGYPDSTYRGNRALTRYEFAAGVNACLQQIERLIAENVGLVTQEDLEILQRLADEFRAELATLGTQVDNLEGDVASLEENQFSTTTKLAGEVIFGLGSVLAGDDADGNELDVVPVLGNRTRLELETSFTGRDLLFTRLSTGNFPEFSEVTGTFEGEVGFAQPDGNDLGSEVLLYSFPIGESSQVLAFATGGAADDVASTVNFLDGDGGSGAVSLFGTRNPIYYPVGDAGLGFRTELGNNFELSLGYLASEASDPSVGSGLFNGSYSGLAQLVFKPSDHFNLGLTYVHGYNQLDTGTGSQLSNFRDLTNTLFGSEVPTSSNSYGVELSWQLSDRFVLGGWAGYTQARTLSTLGGTVDRGSLDIWNWAVTLAFPDLGKEGNLAGIVVGMEPKVTNSSIDLPGVGDEDEDTSLHLEAFYQYQLTDRIAITPGVIWLTAPDHNNDNDDVVIGVLRTTFTF